jgi:hypothetical protein
MACRYIFKQPDGSDLVFNTEAEAVNHIRKNLLGTIKPKRDVANFTTDDMAAALRQNIFGQHNFDPATMRAFQTTLLDEFIRMEKQAEYFYKIGPVVALTKGLGKEFARIDSILENLKDLGIDSEFTNNIPFDVRYILTGDSKYRTEGTSDWFHGISANNVRIAKEVNALARTMFMERTIPFTETTITLLSNLKDDLISDRVEELKDELSAFYQIAAYKQWLTYHQMGSTTLRNSLIYDIVNTTEPTIVDVVKQALDLAPNNAFLNFILPVSTTVRVGKREMKNLLARDLINSIEGKTRGKIEPDMVANMMDSFLELYNNPQTKYHAKALFDYLIVKDGLMFKNKSFIKFIPTLMFKEMSDAVGLATKVMAARSEGQLKELVRELHKLRFPDPAGVNPPSRIFTNEDIASFNRWFVADTKNLENARDLLFRKVFNKSEWELYNSFEQIYASDVRFQFNLHRVEPDSVKNKITLRQGRAEGVTFEKDPITEVGYMHVRLFTPGLNAIAVRVKDEMNPNTTKVNPVWLKRFDAIVDELDQAKFFKSPHSKEQIKDENGNITQQAETHIEFKKFVRYRDAEGVYTLWRLTSVQRKDDKGQLQWYTGKAMVPAGERVPRGVYAKYEKTAVVGAGNTTGVAALGPRPTREQILAAIKAKQELPPSRDTGEAGAAPMVPLGPMPTPGTGGSALQDAGGGTIEHHAGETLDEHPQTDTSSPVDMSKAVNHTGGANGADTQWDIIGREFGVEQHMHYREPGALNVDSKVLSSLGVKPTHISQADFNEGVQKATVAMEQMGRQAGAYAHYQYRNWVQVKYADAVFAIGRLVGRGEQYTQRGNTYTAKSTQVTGGTGYAVQMAINEGKPVYVFDQNRNSWYYASYELVNGKKEFQGFKATREVPRLTKSFAGVGTRDINANGIAAIREVYARTQREGFVSPQQAAAQAQQAKLSNQTSAAPQTKAQVKVVENPWDAQKKGEGVSVMRGKGMHYGNPFSHLGEDQSKYHLIKKASVAEAADAYKQWLLGNYVPQTGEERQFLEEQEPRRKWIINQIKSGALDGKTLLYYASTPYNHAKVLAGLINDKSQLDKPQQSNTISGDNTTSLSSLSSFGGLATKADDPNDSPIEDYTDDETNNAPC